MHPFRKLLLISLGRADAFERIPRHQDWRMLYSMALQQAMSGVLYDGVCRLPENQLPGEGILENWAQLTEQIAGIYQQHEECAAELKDILEGMGLHGCILKGTAIAHLYPRPERRMSGDIDVWVKGTHRQILGAIADAGYKATEILYQECKVNFCPGTTVEVHFHPSKMYNPFLNARLQRCLEELSPIRDDKALTYPDARFNAVFCMAHMYRHYLEGGLGMRQMLDYYYILRVLPPSERAATMARLKRLGMARFTAATMMSLRFNFDLEDEYLLCKPNPKLGRKLVEDIIAMGNFGILDKRNRPVPGESRFARFMRKNKRVFSNFRYYPREVFWSPFARIGQFIWRFFRGYL